MLTSYCSIAYLGVFLPVVVILYSLVPKKFRWLVLLIFSWFFFWLISAKLLVCLLISILSVHHIAVWMALLQKEREIIIEHADKESKKGIKLSYQKKQRAVVLFGVLINIGVLAFFKYTGFFGENINWLMGELKLPVTFNIPKMAAPIGISFYTLQAVSYILDVYNGKITADKNLGRLALFMSFFPQIMEGPICRYSDTANRLWEGEGIHYQNLTFGLQRILFGLLKKMVIADRLNILIAKVFGSYCDYDGGIIAVAAVFYTCQLYMEFSGTMDVVIGSGEIFGVVMPENFTQPFFSKSISEFWHRWHITLGAWFKDYIFYPMSMSKPLKKLTSFARKRVGNYYGPLASGTIALFSVWLCNGLWHGAGWQYIFFGMYHFSLIFLGNLVEPPVRKFCSKTHIDRNNRIYKGLQIIRTCVLVCIGEMFFRADGLRAGMAMFSRLVTKFSFKSFADGSIFKLGMDYKDFIIVIVAVLIVFAISLMKELGIQPRQWLAKQNIAVRWAVYYALILFIIIFGAYGTGYIPVDPIYADF